MQLTTPLLYQNQIETIGLYYITLLYLKKKSSSIIVIILMYRIYKFLNYWNISWGYNVMVPKGIAFIIIQDKPNLVHDVLLLSLKLHKYESKRLLNKILRNLFGTFIL